MNLLKLISESISQVTYELVVIMVLVADHIEELVLVVVRIVELVLVEARIVELELVVVHILALERDN